MEGRELLSRWRARKPPTCHQWQRNMCKTERVGDTYLQYGRPLVLYVSALLLVAARGNKQNDTLAQRRTTKLMTGEGKQDRH